MFCKWCGGNLASSDTKCKRCGKEVPALSDCGGFYDLVPKAKKINVVDPGPTQPSGGTKHTPDQTNEHEPVRKMKSNRKIILGLMMLTVAGFALVLAMLLMMRGKVNSYSKEINGLRNDLRGISEKIDVLEEAALTEEPQITVTMPPVVEEEPVLSEQNVIVNVTIRQLEESQEITTDFDLGDYGDSAGMSYCFDNKDGMISSAAYTLKNAGGCLKLAFNQESLRFTRTLSVVYEIDETAFGLSVIPETCKWQYRFNEESDWEDLPEGDLIGSIGKTGVRFSREDWITSNMGDLELRCEISRSNTDGGSLTIVIEGIRFHNEANN